MQKEREKYIFNHLWLGIPSGWYFYQVPSDSHVAWPRQTFWKHWPQAKGRTLRVASKALQHPAPTHLFGLLSWPSWPENISPNSTRGCNVFLPLPLLSPFHPLTLIHSYSIVFIELHWTWKIILSGHVVSELNRENSMFDQMFFSCQFIITSLKFSFSFWAR